MKYLLLDVMSELGRVAEEMLENSDHGSGPITYTEGIKEDMGDT
ncbi:MAG: hypothetical protein R6U17_05415 [Thermoplasmata archaeon]